jgi:hypothetical protein
MLAQMTDATAQRTPSEAEAAVAVVRLLEMSADLRGCAILAADGSVLAATSDGDAWGAAGQKLLAAADAAGSEPAVRVHVATEDGEAFALRHGGLAIIAVTDRFTLASLMLFDMRAVLRDLTKSDSNGSTPAHREAG